ncbi:MAG: tetratricopeptide repeat protein [Candidatus Acidiferrales bacterium]
MTPATEPMLHPPNSPRSYVREAVLLGCLVLLVLFFGVTATVSRLYHKKIHTLADQWYAQGEQNFQAGNVQLALADYRNALAFSPANRIFQFHLAQALAVAGGGRDEEARNYLLTLLSESPGSGEINLALARISARKGPQSEALRYYQSAIYGEWATDPIGSRWNVRRELCEYLLNRGQITAAEADVISLADNTDPQSSLPEERQRAKIAGSLLLRAQLWERAQQQFRILQAADSHDPDVAAGAGVAAFHLRQYSQALIYFQQLPRERRKDPETAEMIETSRQIFGATPFLPGLSASERAVRASHALDRATSRVVACDRSIQSGANPAAMAILQKLLATSAAMKVDWSERNLERRPESVDPAMAFVFEAENAATQACGEPQGDDKALWLLGQSRGGSQ